MWVKYIVSRSTLGNTPTAAALSSNSRGTPSSGTTDSKGRILAASRDLSIACGNLFACDFCAEPIKPSGQLGSAAKNKMRASLRIAESPDNEFEQRSIASDCLRGLNKAQDSGSSIR